MEVKMKLLVMFFFAVSFEVFPHEYGNPVEIVNVKWGTTKGKVYVDYSGDMGLEGIDFPSRFIFDSIYNIYIFDPSNRKILKLSKDGKLESEIPIDFGKALREDVNKYAEKSKLYKLFRHMDKKYFEIKNSLNSSIVKFKSEESFISLKNIGEDTYLNHYYRDEESKRDTFPTQKEKGTLKLEENKFIDVVWRTQKSIFRQKDIVEIMDRWGNNLGKITSPLTTIKTTIKEGYGPADVEDEFTALYKQIEVDPYGNIYIQGLEPGEYFILKYPKIYYKPVAVSKIPAKKTPKGIYNVSEYSIIPPRKVKKSGFKLFKENKEISYRKIYEKGSIQEIKYLGKDNLGQYWVYYEVSRTKKVGNEYFEIKNNNRDWMIIKKEKDRFFRKAPWMPVVSSEYVRVKNKTVPGIITTDKVNLDKVKISTDGDLCYKSGENWYKQKYIQGMEFEKSDVKDFIKPDENITVKSYAEYEEIDPLELERGIEIKKVNESIRKFKYYYQDTLYTVQNLGSDDKNNIYVYVNWFDWLTKDKMKEVVKFNTKGEFQNRISLTAGETPVLGVDGFIYTSENGEKAVVRKYEPKTLP